MDHCCSDGESLIFYNTRSGEKEFFKRKLTGNSGTANDYLWKAQKHDSFLNNPSIWKEENYSVLIGRHSCCACLLVNCCKLGSSSSRSNVISSGQVCWALPPFGGSFKTSSLHFSISAWRFWAIVTEGKLVGTRSRSRMNRSNGISPYGSSGRGALRKWPGSQPTLGSLNSSFTQLWRLSWWLTALVAMLCCGVVVTTACTALNMSSTEKSLGQFLFKNSKEKAG